MSIMVNRAPAILPSHPNLPKTRNAPAINPTMLSPDTLPLPRLLKKFSNMFPALPPPIPPIKLEIPSREDDKFSADWLTPSMALSALSVRLLTLAPAESKVFPIWAFRQLLHH